VGTGELAVLLEQAVRVFFVVVGPVDLAQSWRFDEPEGEKVPVGGDFRGWHPATLSVAVQIIPYKSFDAIKDAPAEIAFPGAFYSDASFKHVAGHGFV